MKITARHERDDEDIELATYQLVELAEEFGLDLYMLYDSGIRKIVHKDGWTYTFHPY